MPKGNARKRGKSGEKYVAKLLKRWCRKNRARLLNGIYLPLYKGYCEIDHLVIGSFGVMAVETKTLAGTIEGAPADKTLTHRVGSKTHKLYNPLYQNKTHTDNISHHLKKAGFSSVPVYGEVVFAGECIPPKGLGIPADKLIKRLDGLPAGNTNPKQIKKLFLRLSVKNPIKKLLHLFSVKKKSA